jgi:hypothetical protein
MMIGETGRRIATGLGAAVLGATVATGVVAGSSAASNVTALARSRPTRSA